MHKFKIIKTEKGEFRVQFVYNAEVMVWWENYASKASAKNCVESLKKNAPAAPVVDLTKEETGSGYRFEIDQATLWAMVEEPTPPLAPTKATDRPSGSAPSATKSSPITVITSPTETGATRYSEIPRWMRSR